MSDSIKRFRDDKVVIKGIAFTVALIVITLMFSSCLLEKKDKDIAVSGKYSSTSQEGIEAFIEFDKGQLRLGSQLNTGGWRNYTRDGNTITVTGINSNGSSSTVTINILDEDTVEVENFAGSSQDVVFVRH
jgi:hypothetical protein